MSLHTFIYAMEQHNVHFPFFYWKFALLLIFGLVTIKPNKTALIFFTGDNGCQGNGLETLIDNCLETILINVTTVWSVLP